MSTEFHPSFLPPMFCAACEDSGQELDGLPCLDCGGSSYLLRLRHEAERTVGADDEHTPRGQSVSSEN